MSDRGRAESAPAPTDGAAPTWVPWAALGLVVAVQIVLLARAFTPAPHSGGDNAGYLSLAFSLLDRGAYLDLYAPGEPRHIKYPPGYALVLAAAMLVGARTWASFKVLSAAFMVLSVAAAYRWVQVRAGWLLAFGIAVVLAFSDSFVYSSLWILSDPLFLVLTLLAILAFDRALAGAVAGGRADPDVRWWALGVALALLAYFTRSAGLPLVVAALGVLALRRAWRTLGWTAVAIGIPALLWWLRSRTVGPGAYASEFWWVNPYQPDLGRVGPGELLGRVVRNVHVYVGGALPSGLTGTRGPLTVAAGYALVGFAAVGWVWRMRKEIGVAELFLPLYAGLILLWPDVWSGDRFALPLFPLVLYYAALPLGALAAQGGRAAPALVGTALVLATVLPASQAWARYARQGAGCRAVAAQAGVFACYRAPLQDFATAAAWSSRFLPDGAVVVVRKPRIFYALSGVQAVSLPFREDPGAWLAEARAGGAGYALADYIDGLSELYLLGTVERRPDAFCPIADFGDRRNPPVTRLFGMPGSRGAAPGEDAPSLLGERLCPNGVIRREPVEGLPQSPDAVPLLSRLDS